MEVQGDHLNKLKCNYCEKYLSRGPIYLEHNGYACCGACYSSDRPATRNTHYEELAKLAFFPCKYQQSGCKLYVPFITESTTDHHEDICEYREFACPVSSTSCDWVGRGNYIHYHCQNQHADKVENSPFNFTLDITKSSTNTFFLQAFQMLFLLYTKVCLTSGNIYLYVQYLGCPSIVDYFIFNLKVMRHDVQILKEGKVDPKLHSDFEESTSTVLNISGLLNVLNGWDDTTFTITVEKIAKSFNTCVKCGLVFFALAYRDSEGWKCERCIRKHNCNQYKEGCNYRDSEGKRNKHSNYFCNKKTFCYLCQQSISDTLITHYNADHAGITFTSDSVWRATLAYYEQYRIINCTIGIVIYRYSLNENNFVLSLFSLAPRKDLHNIRCVVTVTNPILRCTRVFPLDFSYIEDYDWRLKLTKKDFTLAEEIDVCVTITKVN